MFGLKEEDYLSNVQNFKQVLHNKFFTKEELQKSEYSKELTLFIFSIFQSLELRHAAYEHEKIVPKLVKCLLEDCIYEEDLDSAESLVDAFVQNHGKIIEDYLYTIKASQWKKTYDNNLHLIIL